MKKKLDEILKTIQEHKDTIKNYGVSSLGLFGSHARGEGEETSDLDVLVEFQRKSFDAYMDLKLYLEGLLGCPVDLVLKDALKERLRAIILKETIRVPGL